MENANEKHGMQMDLHLLPCEQEPQQAEPTSSEAPAMTAAEIERIVRVAYSYKRKNPWANLEDLIQEAYRIIFETWEKYKSTIDTRGVIGYMRIVVDNGLRDYVLKEKAPCSIPKRPTRAWFEKNPLHRAGARVSAAAAYEEHRNENPAVRAMFARVKARIYEALPQETTEDSTSNEDWDLKVRERTIELLQESLSYQDARMANEVLLNEQDVAEVAEKFSIGTQEVKLCLKRAKGLLRADPILRRLMALKAPRARAGGNE